MAEIDVLAQNESFAAEDSRTLEHFDVLIVGAGLSGIGADYHLQKKCPSKTFAILESRKT
jgi:monooxygenase